MPVTAETLTELRNLGFSTETIIAIVTLFERDASRDASRADCDGKAAAADRARRYRARQRDKLGMAQPGTDGDRHAGRHVTHHVTERDADINKEPSLLEKKEETKEGSSTASIVEGRKPKRRQAIALPENWQPNTNHFSAGRKLGLSDERLSTKADDLRIWARANDIRKADWDATFHGFLRREADQKLPSRNGGAAPRPGSKEDTRERTVLTLRSLDPLPEPDEPEGSQGASAEIPRLLPFVKPP